jgi:hypothetical protein
LKSKVVLSPLTPCISGLLPENIEIQEPIDEEAVTDYNLNNFESSLF